MLPKVCLVGRPNVGKSTLFNRIIGTRLSITDDCPGVTRDRIYAKANWLGKEFSLIDTGGIEISSAPFLTEIKAQVEIALDEADVIIFVADSRNGLTDDDQMIAKLLYKTKKPVLLVVNKVDDQKYLDAIYEFYQLGFSDPIALSATHSIGVGDLLDKVVELLPDKSDNDYDESITKFCVVGRPNVGKSSLVNTILGENRVITSNVEGTTRDSIDSLFTRDNKEYVIIDTAGIRKSGKVYENAEKYSVIRALDSIDRSDVCLLLIDASIGIREQDKHVAGYVKDSYKPCVIVVNKWDAIDKETNTMQKWIDDIRANFQFLPYAPIVFVSALENKRIQTIFDELEKIKENYNRRVNTSVLNEVITDSVAMNPTPNTSKGKSKFYYASQVDAQPPTFVLFVNDPELVHFSYVRYLENMLRRNFDFYGTPIRIILRRRE
jgi:GTP-binding protein